MTRVGEYFWHIFAAASQLLNACLGGHPDQTLSARAWLNREGRVWGLVYRVINRIFFWQGDHCLQSHLNDKRMAATLPVA